MKYIKTFENNDETQKGEYVLCDLSKYIRYENRPEVVNFVNTNIGIIESVKRKTNYNMDIEFQYLIKYKNVPRELEQSFHYASNNIWINEEYIVDHSFKFDEIQSKLDMKLDSKKYNI